MASRTAAVVVLLALASLGCAKPAPLAFGKSVDASAAVPVAELLSRQPPPGPGPVTVSGRISRVCRSTGCWFVLSGSAKGLTYELMVDLKARATFTVPPDIAGRSAVAAGVLARGDEGLRLDADGLALP